MLVRAPETELVQSPAPRRNGRADLKKEYTDFMSFMNEKKKEEIESYYAKLPYKFGYLLLLIIVVVIIIHSTVTSYNTVLERERKL